MKLLRRIHCSICGRWFGRHDLLMLHNDGRTDNTLAIQHMLGVGSSGE